MNNAGNEQKGIIIRKGNILRINNALVEETYFEDRYNGFIIISYAAKDPDIAAGNKRINTEILRLNIGRGTIITNQFYRPLNIGEINTGMVIDAEFSQTMTKSLPPQTNAYRIIVRQCENEKESPKTPEGPKKPEKLPEELTATGRIARIYLQNSDIITGSKFNIYRQMLFNVTDDTVILDRRGGSIPLSALRPGLYIRIKHAAFKTASIPPQALSYKIQVL